MATSHREHKSLLYTKAAKVGIASGSPIRLELLELLAQRERSVRAMVYRWIIWAAKRERG